jgi:hypothetical protein
MNLNYLVNVIAFCALMESNGGISNKSPDYVIEKFKRYCLSLNKEEYNWGLDKDNQRTLFAWILKWAPKEDDTKGS